MRPRIGLAAGEWADRQILPVEIEALGTRLSPAALARAASRARQLEVGADEVLLAQGLVTPDEAARAAARRLGVSFAPLGDPAPAALPLPPEPLADLLRRGVLRGEMFRETGGRFLVAARGRELRELAARLLVRPELRPRLMLTTPERLGAFLRRSFAAPLGERAAFRLLKERPERSAATLGVSRLVMAGLGLVLAALPFLMQAGPAMVMLPVATLIAFLLLGWSYLRIAACTMSGTPETEPLTDDRLLPRYSLIVPLYREARIVPQLIAALDALDYPREKLQVLLVIEPDDQETAAALARNAGLPGFEVIVAPDMGPRTKPKALNAALDFARGEVIGVYDAEDVPDPLQLRRVASVMRGARGERIGCVQARLAIDNMADSWITRQFAAEYASHFDVVLPVLGRLELPVPLGGTSNHFRREVLERLGAWDPYNVTEDADLGVRLAREGWRTAVIASTTDEEAPRRAGAWLLQRTRWYKGWMQTLLVHGRHPARLAREAGWIGALALLLLLGGGVTAALMHPFFAVALLVSFISDHRPIDGVAGAMLQGLGVAVLVLGCASALTTTLVGMKRRGLPGLWRVLPLIPAYWLMMSLAAWRALFQLLVAPQRWEKTAHGFARTSRRKRGRGVWAGTAKKLAKDWPGVKEGTPRGRGVVRLRLVRGRRSLG